MSGEYSVLLAGEDNRHITLEDEEHLQNFDDNINSAICTCVKPIPNYHPTNKFAYYMPARFDLRRSFVGEPVSFITQRMYNSYYFHFL